MDASLNILPFDYWNSGMDEQITFDNNNEYTLDEMRAYDWEFSDPVSTPFQLGGHFPEASTEPGFPNPSCPLTSSSSSSFSSSLSASTYFDNSAPMPTEDLPPLYSDEVLSSHAGSLDIELTPNIETALPTEMQLSNSDVGIQLYPYPSSPPTRGHAASPKRMPLQQNTMENQAIQETDTRSKKSSHNVIEKRYRNNLNDKIVALRDAVPSLRVASKRPEDGAILADDYGKLSGLQPVYKLNKPVILDKAAEYIRHLEYQCSMLRESRNQARAKHRALEEFIAAESQRGVFQHSLKPLVPPDYNAYIG